MKVGPNGQKEVDRELFKIGVQKSKRLTEYTGSIQVRHPKSSKLNCNQKKEDFLFASQSYILPSIRLLLLKNCMEGQLYVFLGHGWALTRVLHD